MIDVIAKYGNWKTSKPVEEEVYNAIYDKAIDDFVNECRLYRNNRNLILMADVEDIAESLKGEKNDG